MVEDARFEDAGDKPLRLMAADAEDLQIISSLIQDSVFPVGEMAFHKADRRFALLLNRFRWEDDRNAERHGRAYERVQAVLSIDDVEAVKSQGIERSDKDMILSALALTFEPGEDGTGRLELTLAGDGALSFDVESLNVTLVDVTRPYVAPSRARPGHPE